jgi:hypothetical protein
MIFTCAIYLRTCDVAIVRGKHVSLPPQIKAAQQTTKNENLNYGYYNKKLENKNFSFSLSPLIITTYFNINFIHPCSALSHSTARARKKFALDYWGVSILNFYSACQAI